MLALFLGGFGAKINVDSGDKIGEMETYKAGFGHFGRQKGRLRKVRLPCGLLF